MRATTPDLSERASEGQGGTETPATTPATSPRVAGLDEGIRAFRAISRWSCPESCGLGWLFASVKKDGAGCGRRALIAIESVLEKLADSPIRFVVVVGEHVDVSSVDEAMFHWCANCDVSRDMTEFKDAAGNVVRLGFDATPKVPGDERHGQPVRAWPPILEMSKDIRELVERRWTEYGLASTDPLAPARGQT